MTDYAINIQGLSKRFRSVQAVDQLDLQVSRGEVYGLLGRNGAGKTTTIRLLMGLLNPTAGEARVAGINMHSATPEERQRVAYVSQSQMLYRGHTGEEHAHMLSRLYAHWDAEYARATADHFSLDLSRVVGALSGGQQRILAVVLALATRAEVLLLDEPAAGLDPLARRKLIEALSEMLVDSAERTVLLSTHLVDDVERIATQVGFMDSGSIQLSRPIEELRERMRRVQIVATGDALPAGISVPGTIRETREGVVLTSLCSLPSPDALQPLETRSDLRVQSFPMSLEEIFIAFFDDNVTT
jgi:ABC-2 type transport system ATP-binding protein